MNILKQPERSVKKLVDGDALVAIVEEQQRAIAEYAERIRHLELAVSPMPHVPISDRAAFLRMLCADQRSVAINEVKEPTLPLAKQQADAFFERVRADGFYRRAIEYDVRKLDPHWGHDEVKVDSREGPFWYLNGFQRLAVLAVYAPDSEWRIYSAQNTPRQPIASGSGSTVLLNYVYLHYETYWRVEGAESLVVAVARRV